jgi:hypothetical protein
MDPSHAPIPLHEASFCARRDYYLRERRRLRIVLLVVGVVIAGVVLWIRGIG